MSSQKKRRFGPLLIAFLVFVMLVLHQDNWNWHNDELVFGFIPIGLYYHARLSLIATFVWFLATQIAWPVELIEETKAAVEQRPPGEASAEEVQ
ncbi:DUF3311 domain-containing protein [Roseimaritima sediminicola]|uniref:DUF3311 domain-containing protein n=1 Tax=Roseimaritima sediminicola TaxID=2662066 RepID=UPI00129824AA|nr:DUF3311 domain-containing protein [Roseimaritima sediminicola]